MFNYKLRPTQFSSFMNVSSNRNFTTVFLPILIVNTPFPFLLNILTQKHVAKKSLLPENNARFKNLLKHG